MEPVVMTVEGGSDVRVFMLELPGPLTANALTVTFDYAGGLRRIKFLGPNPVEEAFALIDDRGEVTVRDIRSRQLEGYRFSVEFVGPEGEPHQFLAVAVEELVNTEPDPAPNRQGK